MLSDYTVTLHLRNSLGKSSLLCGVIDKYGYNSINRVGCRFLHYGCLYSPGNQNVEEPIGKGFVAGHVFYFLHRCSTVVSLWISDKGHSGYSCEYGYADISLISIGTKTPVEALI